MSDKKPDGVAITAHPDGSTTLSMNFCDMSSEQLAMCIQACQREEDRLREKKIKLHEHLKQRLKSERLAAIQKNVEAMLKGIDGEAPGAVMEITAQKG